MSERREDLDQTDDPTLEEADRVCAELPSQIEHARQLARDLRRNLLDPRPVNDNRRRDHRH